MSEDIDDDLYDTDFAEWRLQQIRAAHKRIQAERGEIEDESVEALDLDVSH